MEEPTALEMFEKLEYLILEEEGENQFGIKGNVPSWYQAHPNGRQHFTHAQLFDLFPMLSGFLPEVDHYLHTSNPPPYIESRIWEQENMQGAKDYFSCTALLLNQRTILLIEKKGNAFEEKRVLLQRAREQQLVLEQLESQHQQLLLNLKTILPDVEEPLKVLNQLTATQPSMGESLENQQKARRLRRQIERLTQLLGELNNLLPE